MLAVTKTVKTTTLTLCNQEVEYLKFILNKVIFAGETGLAREIKDTFEDTLKSIKADDEYIFQEFIAAVAPVNPYNINELSNHHKPLMRGDE